MQKLCKVIAINRLAFQTNTISTTEKRKSPELMTNDGPFQDVTLLISPRFINYGASCRALRCHQSLTRGMTMTAAATGITQSQNGKTGEKLAVSSVVRPRVAVTCGSLLTISPLQP
jgi:hypothetical protein